MAKNNNFLLVFYILLGLGVIFGLYTIDSSLEKPSGPLNLAPVPVSNTTITEVVDIETEFFFTILSDVENYPRVLPNNILSVNMIEETNSSLIYEITLMEKGVKTTLLIEQESFPYEKQILTVIEGDAKNTTITQKFQNQGNSTKLITEIEIELSGVLTPFGFIPQLNFNNAMATILSNFIEYSTEKTQNEKIVDDIYRDILKRSADKEGLFYFTSLLEQNKITPDEIRIALYDSDEYTSRFLSSDLKTIEELSDEVKNSIDKFYELILRRSADSVGMQHFGSLLESKKFTEFDIINELLNSSEYNSLPDDPRRSDLLYKDSTSKVVTLYYQYSGLIEEEYQKELTKSLEIQLDANRIKYDAYLDLNSQPIHNKLIYALVILLDSKTITIDQVEEILSNKFKD